MSLEQVSARLLWYGLAPSTRKTYTTATYSYIKYCAVFGKRAFPTLVGDLTSWIGYLEGKRLKAKTIKRYLAGLQSLHLECTLDEAELKVYSHPMLQRIIKSFWRIYKEGDIWQRRPITCDILLKLISRFDSTTLKRANLHAVFCLAFAEFFRMGEFTYNKVESDFNSWNLTWGLVSFFKD